MLSSALVGAEDLTTRDGKVYHDYKVLAHDAGFITIMYSDGGGKIPLSQLPDDLQKKYGYDKAAADAAIQAAAAQEQRDQQAVTNEAKAHQAQIAAQATAETGATPQVVAPTPTPTPSVNVVAPDQSSQGMNVPGQPTPAIVAPSPGAMSVDQRQAQIADLKSKLDALKARIRTYKEARARQDVIDQVQQKQNAENPANVTSPLDDQLTQMRQQLHTLKMSAPAQPIPNLSPDQVADVREKIHNLEAADRDMQERLDLHILWDPVSFDYPDIMEDNNDQVAVLKAELPATVADGQDESAAQALGENDMPADLGISPTGPLTSQDIQVINDRIKSLQDDLTFMEKEEARHVDPVTGQHDRTPTGAYPAKIALEKKQVAALQARLQQGGAQ